MRSHTAVGGHQGQTKTRPSSLAATILVVEDEEVVLEAAAEVLLSAGYRVLKARTPAEAVETFCKQTEELQLLLTDVVLPGQDGRRLASYLGELRPGFKTIFISGYPENVITRNASEGIFYIAKPFSLDLLVQKVQQLLSGSNGTDSKVKRASCTG
jgi:CheY-like chemotaxis protein